MRSTGGWQAGWDEATLQSELATVLEGRTQWPSRGEFEALGRVDLYAAVKRRGGVRTWSRRLGLTLTPTQAHVANPFSAGAAESSARELMHEHGYLPRAERLRELGHGRLASYVNQHHRSSTAYVRAQGWGDNVRPRKGHVPGAASSPAPRAGADPGRRV